MMTSNPPSKDDREALGVRLQDYVEFVWIHMVFFPKLGVPFWGTKTKDYKIWGLYGGSPNFGKLPHIHMTVLPA